MVLFVLVDKSMYIFFNIQMFKLLILQSVFFVWLMIPTNLNGSLMIYRNIIQPYFLQYHKVVDKAVNAVHEKGKLLH